MKPNLITQWAGSKAQGLSLMSANMEASKYKKKYPKDNVVIEELDFKSSQDRPLYCVAVYSY